MSQRRYQLTDFEWSVIAPLLPNKPRGVPRVDDRRVLNGIFWVLRTGAPWRDLPDDFGPWATVWDLFNTWNDDGTLITILKRLRGQVEIDDELWCVDGTIVRAARCAAGGGKKGMSKNRRITRLVEVAAV